MPRIVFTPSGRDGQVDPGSTVLEAARYLGVDLDSICSGRGLCGRCQVVPSVGSFAKWSIESAAGSLSTAGSTEANYHGARPLAAGARLGCTAQIEHDVVVDVPPMSQRHRPVVRKSLDVAGIIVDSGFELAYIELATPDLDDTPSAADQIRTALETQHDRLVPLVSLPAIRAAQHAFHKGDRAITVAISLSGHAPEVVSVWPGFVDAAYGVAIDLGSTTIAAHLCDLATGEVVASSGAMNPQIRLGEDLMSRVSYVMMNPGGDLELTVLAQAALDQLLGELVEEARVTRDRVLELVVVGNPIMTHLFLGIDPTPLGQAPFELATDGSVTAPAPSLGINAPFASVYVLPCIAGHVGADTAAVILSEGPHRSSTVQLLVDVGTNAEIVLGNDKWQFAASSPTGPAFEGAQISCGQRATAGAIERVRIDRTTLAPRYKIIGSDLWSDEDDFAAAATRLGVTGVCGSGIIEVVGEMFLAGVIDADGVVQGTFDSPHIVADGRTFSYVLSEGDGPTLRITQNDVRAIQLAKAALRAGIDLLVERAVAEHGIAPELTDIRLAGAFGAHIDPLYAMVLGLVPDCPLEGMRSVGNAAGVGAARALLSVEQRAEIEAAIRGVHKIETATEANFQDLFVAAMAFPHRDALSPHLAEHVTVPERTVSNSPTNQRRRRQRKQAASEGPTS